MVEREPDIDIERSPARRGPAVVASGPVATPMPAVNVDRVTWGPVWAGFVVSLLSLLILGSLATAIGLAATLPQGDLPGTPAAEQAGTGIGAALVVLLSLFAGGLACGYLMGDRPRAWGAIHGVLVAGLVLSIVTLLLAMGSLGASNALANVFGALDLSRVFNPRAYTGVPATEIAAAAARAAGWFTVTSLLCVAACAAGGYLGVKLIQDRLRTGHSA